MIRFGERFDLSYEDMVVGAYRACLDSVDNGIDDDRIEAAWLGTCVGSLIRQETVTGAALAEPLRFFPRPVSRVENACCTGSDAVRNAAMAVAAGVYDVVLVVGAEKMRDVPSRDSLIRQTGVMFHEWWKPRGATAPNRFGQYATAHMDAYGTTREHLALIAEKNHHFGSLNPNAYFRREVDVRAGARRARSSRGRSACSTAARRPTAPPPCCSPAPTWRTQFTDHPLYFRGHRAGDRPADQQLEAELHVVPGHRRGRRQAFSMAGIEARATSTSPRCTTASRSPSSSPTRTSGSANAARPASGWRPAGPCWAATSRSTPAAG